MKNITKKGNEKKKYMHFNFRRLNTMLMLMS